jgi:hypothetical protein
MGFPSAEHSSLQSALHVRRDIGPHFRAGIPSKFFVGTLEFSCRFIFITCRRREVDMRGLLAQLSPREAGMLKLLSSPGAAISHGHGREIEQLKKLGLIEVRNGNVEVTRLGRQRLLAETPAGYQPSTTVEDASQAGD